MKKDIKEIEEELSDKVAEKGFWKEKYEHCLKCIKDCKQSSKIQSLNCPNYKEKN